jgi:hypothetical protein
MTLEEAKSRFGAECSPACNGRIATLAALQAASPTHGD